MLNATSRIMTSTHPLQLEQQLEVVPTEKEDVFTNRYPAWGHLSVPHVMGSVLMGHAALAAYKTVPPSFSLHAVQARFLGAALKPKSLHYVVKRIATTSRTACRVVQVEQENSTKVLITFSFIGASPEDTTPQLFHHVPSPSQETSSAISTSPDPELDDAYKTLYGVIAKKPPGWPSNTPYPAISNIRLSVTGKESEISQRTYRIKVRTIYPNTSSKAQLVAALFFSDFYILDTPLTVQDIPWGFREIGDRSTNLSTSKVKILSTLNHTLHFCTTGGFDVQEGLLLEAVTKWAKGRRAAIGITIWDTKGKLVATGEQEGYFVFVQDEKAQQSKI